MRWPGTPSHVALCCLTRLTFAFNAVSGFLLREAQVVEGLQVQPEFGRRVEIARQAEGGIGGDAALAADDLVEVLEAAGEGTKMAVHFSPIFRPAFPSSAIISERSSPSRVRFAAPNNGAPLTAPGRSGQHF
jgi:hypothetical protein